MRTIILSPVSIFVPMIMERIQAVLFTLVILLPLFVATIGQISDLGNVYELVEISQECEEQNDEKGSEEKECKDGVEEYLAHEYYSISTNQNTDFGSFLGITGLHLETNDVLTPPPEYI